MSRERNEHENYCTGEKENPLDIAAEEGISCLMSNKMTKVYQINASFKSTTAFRGCFFVA